MADSIPSDAAAIIRAAREGQESRILTIEHGGVVAPILLTALGNGSFRADNPKGFLDAFRANPERRQGVAVLTDLASFEAHALRFKDANSAIFVVPSADDATPPSFLAVLDYHEAVAMNPEALPRFGKHRGSYAPAFSAEWEAWTGKSGKGLDQATFAAFVSEHAADILDVEGRAGMLTDLPAWFADRFGGKVVREGGPASFFASCQVFLDLSEGLSITVTDKIVDVKKRDNGSTSISFESSATTSTDIPPAFVIAIPVFERGDLYQIPGRLKMTVRTSGDTKRAEWRLDLYGIERVLRAAVDADIAHAKATTGLPVFMGSPEGTT